MKTPTASSATSSQREQTSLLSQVPRLPRSNVCSTRDLENPSASVHPKRFSTPSLTLKFLCAGKLNPRLVIGRARGVDNQLQRILIGAQGRPTHGGNFLFDLWRLQTGSPLTMHGIDFVEIIVKRKSPFSRSRFSQGHLI